MVKVAQPRYGLSEPDTWARCTSSRNDPELVGGELGVSKAARSQTAISLAGIGEGDDGENLSCQDSALRPGKFSPEQERQDESWRGRHECLRHVYAMVRGRPLAGPNPSRQRNKAARY